MKPRRIQFGWIITGIIMLGALILLSIHPEFVTHFKPSRVKYENFATGQSAPFPPSHTHPFGTDQVGHDLLARVLAGTANTLLPAVYITLLVLVLSIVLSALAATSSNRVVARAIQSIGGIMSALPALLLLLLVMGQKNHLSAHHQELQYILWIAVFEIGRGAYAFYESMETWFSMDFVEAATMIGRSRFGILRTHLRSWFTLFTLEFAFSEFARILSIMTMLAAFHIYPVETMSNIPFFISFPPVLGIQSAQNTWIAMVGDSTNNFAFVSYPYFLYAPTLALLTTVMGANFIARGFRGTVKS